MSIDKHLLDKRKDILAIAARYGASNVRVFGSAARDDVGPGSDFDFLVDFQPEYTIWDHIGLIQDLSQLLGRRVDVVLEKNLRERYRPYIMAGAVSL